MWFSVLGPIDVRDDNGVGVAPTAPRLSTLLAVLLCRPNQLLSTDRLVDLVWEGRPSRAAHNSLHVYVHRLRQALGEDRVVREMSGYRLVVRPNEFDVTCFEQGLAEAGAARRDRAPDRAAGLFVRALGQWRDERPYGGLSDGNEIIHGERTRLMELRMSALEWRMAAGLAAGEHATLVDELRALVERYPQRQLFPAQLMCALQRAGYPDEALAVYDRAERLLVEAYGLEPGAQLREARQRILDATGSPAAGVAGPSDTLEQSAPGPAEPAPESGPDGQVDDCRRPPTGRPAARPDRRPSADGTVANGTAADGSGSAVPGPEDGLVGRREELSAVVRWLTSAGSGDSRHLPVMAISGPGGVGKSALARLAARELDQQFPDGQLYVNLRGADGQLGHLGMEPIDALSRLLTDLGEPPNRIPGFEDEAAARFRSLTADRRLLVVLDDAYDAAQVRPLLPGANGPGVLVTGRRALTALDDAEVVTLAPLGREEALDLLERTVGDDRVAAEPVAASEVVELSGGLPMAVRIVGARLLAQPRMTLGALAIRLRERRGRLDEWEHAAQGVRASFELGYQALSPTAAELFDLMGVLDLAEMDRALLAAAAGLSDSVARRRLDELVDAQLLNPVPGKPDRFGLHDLLRLYARERADRRAAAGSDSSLPSGSVDETADETVAEPDRERRPNQPGSGRGQVLHWIRRAVHHYIATGRAATDQFTRMAARRRTIGIADADLLVGGRSFTHSGEAVAWIRVEAENVLTVMRLTGELPPDESGAAAAGLAAALGNPLRSQAFSHRLIELNLLAAKAVSAGSDPGMYTVIERDLAGAYLQAGQPTEALAHYRRDRDRCECRDDPYGTAIALQGIGLSLRELPGELPAAADAFSEAFRLHGLIGNEVGQGSALNNLANVRLAEGDLEAARQLYEQASEIHARTGERGRRATVRANLAELYEHAGQLEEAAATYTEVVAELRAAGYSVVEMCRLWDLGDVLCRLGRMEQARQRWRAASELAVALGVLAPEEVESVLSAPRPVRPRGLVANG